MTPAELAIIMAAAKQQSLSKDRWNAPVKLTYSLELDDSGDNIVAAVITMTNLITTDQVTGRYLFDPVPAHPMAMPDAYFGTILNGVSFTKALPRKGAPPATLSLEFNKPTKRNRWVYREGRLERKD